MLIDRRYTKRILNENRHFIRFDPDLVYISFAQELNNFIYIYVWIQWIHRVEVTQSGPKEPINETGSGSGYWYGDQ